MDTKVMNILFLCTGNSARSIFAESIINKLGGGRFRGFSAGSHPRGEVHPVAVQLLEKSRFPIEFGRIRAVCRTGLDFSSYAPHYFIISIFIQIL